MEQPPAYALMPVYDKDGEFIGSAIMEYAGYVIPPTASTDPEGFATHIERAFTIKPS